MSNIESIDLVQLTDNIKAWGLALGFQQVGIADIDLSRHEKHLVEWLDNNYHGEMGYMEKHGMKRARPAELVPGTLRVISVRMDYLPPDASFANHLSRTDIAYISRYALGRDYHKTLRNRLNKLGKKISEALVSTEFRAFVDSAPVLEHAIAEKAGLGWTGKHTLTLNREAGSWFFLGELFVNLPLPVDQPAKAECGSCTACIKICPTQAIVAPYTLDARRCISYLTIEYDGEIPESLRPLVGNRIYGCDDCQLVCPWNRFAKLSQEPDFLPRKHLHGRTLVELLAWDETTFLKLTEGSPIRRIGFEKWQRNIAVAMGNADFDANILTAIDDALLNASSLVKTHLLWAKQQQQARREDQYSSKTRLSMRLIRTIKKGLPRDT